MTRILIPLPDFDFDPTEVSVPWHLLHERGHQVIFATEDGDVAPAADPRLLKGVLFKQLGAEKEPREFYEALTGQLAFRRPLAWRDLDMSTFDGLILPGGHAPGMRQYLGSSVLHAKVTEFWQTGRPVGAICHGVIALARSIDPTTGESVIAGSATTSLTKSMERTAFYLTAWKLGRYYRTYPKYVEDEVRSVLRSRRQYRRGPRRLQLDSNRRDTSGFVVQDGHYLSARWPGDAYTFARRFVELLEGIES